MLWRRQRQFLAQASTPALQAAPHGFQPNPPLPLLSQQCTDLSELLQRSKRQRGMPGQRQQLGLARRSEEEEAEAEEAAAGEAAAEPADVAMEEGAAAAEAGVAGEAAAGAAPPAPSAAAPVAAAETQTEQREEQPRAVQAGRPQLWLVASTAAQTAALPTTVHAGMQARSRRSGAAQTLPPLVPMAAAAAQTAGVDAGMQHRAQAPSRSAGTQTSAGLGKVDRKLQVG